jgi:tRNA nucleotidyltransferase/poly(A) polymerase
MIKLYEVGGSIRDEFLGVPTKDRDYCVIAESYDAMKTYLLEQGAKIYLERPEFVAIRCRMPGLGDSDFVLGRKDGFYSDGRHPDSVEIVTDIREELARRDFTINAMARDVETGEIIDPFDGKLDLSRRLIKFVGNPLDRLMEDKLRAFRALRFSVTKRFNFSIATMTAIEKLIPSDFDSVSTERIREELFKMFRVNTKLAFTYLFSHYPNLGKLVLDRGIWFKPTTESAN